MRQIILYVHDVRSCHNVGSLLRTADGLGAERVILGGYTPFPALPADDPRLPHEAARQHRQICKTSLGAEQSVAWERAADPASSLEILRQDGYTVIALEQTPTALALTAFTPPGRSVLVVGNEVTGLPNEVLALCDNTVAIPMLGQKESFNVVQAAAMALYHLRFAGTDQSVV